MTAPDETIRKVIENEIQPRLDGHRTYLAAAEPDPLPVARAELLYLWDDFHNEYLDWASLNNPVGHAHPIVAHPVAEHYRYYGHTAPQGRHAQRWPVQYAQDLSEQFTGQGETPRKVLFTEGEREAVLVGIDLACRHSCLRDFIVVGDNYITRLNGLPYRYYPTVFDPADANWYMAGALLLNMADDQAHTMRPGVARRWMLAAREAGVPVIVDETVTGFGRLGRMWGFQATGLVPDVIVLGGAAGGGYPLGAVVAPPSYFDGQAIDVSSQAGNPIACCAGASVLTAIGLGTLEYMSESDPLLANGLDELVKQFGHYLSGHHGWGHLRGLRLKDVEMAGRLVADARAQGLLLAPSAGTTVVLAPVLITSTHELTRGVDILASVFLSWDEQAG